jgi:DNA-binding MarR family transcriptional regulator
MDRNELIRSAIDRFNRVVTKFALIDRNPRDFGSGERLTRAEIHLIAAVGDRPLVKVTDLARTMGVTKGAVSQNVGRLVRKEYLKKLRSMDNDKEVLLLLTEKGEVAYRGHERYHAELFEKYQGRLAEEDVRKFNSVLAKIEKFADDYLADR